MSAQVIGYLGENGVRDVRIPIGHLLDKWQGLRPLLVMVPVGGSDDEAYPVQHTLDGTDLVWHVSDADTAVAGTTKAAVRMVDDGGRVGMDEPFQVIISPNLSAGGEPPVVIKPWVDKLTTLVPRAEEAAERAENAAQNWENGTAPNALALGDKPPEYYLPAVQLLDNPDFSIAQAGYNAMHGTTKYAADRWVCKSGVENIAYGAEYATLTSSGDYRAIYQVVDVKRMSGAYTFAFKYKVPGDESSRLYAGIEQNGEAASQWNFTDAGDGWRQVVLNFDASILSGAETAWFSLTTYNLTSAYVKDIVLYPGTYTAETLPPFVPRPYAVELAECQLFYRRKKINVWFQWFWENAMHVEVTHEKMRIDSPTVNLLSANFLNTNLPKYEKWIWTDFMPYLKTMEYQTPNSFVLNFEDADNPFTEKMAYQGNIEYEIIADL